MAVVCPAFRLLLLLICASGFIIFRTKPPFNIIENLTANIHSFASIIRRNSKTTYQNSRVIHTSFGIIYTSLNTIPC